MKKICASMFMLGVVMFALLTGSANASAASFEKVDSSTYRGAVLEDETNLYAGYSRKSEVLATLDFGTKVKLLQESPRWYKVKVNGVKGYIPKKYIVKYDKTKKHIALTFDDGPQATNTKIVLAALKKYNCRATFFVVGQCINDTTGKLMKQAVKLGCEYGNHSYSHPQLTKLSYSSCQSQASKTDALIKKYTGKEAKLFRTPYGSYNSSVLKAINRPNIFWSVDTEDWKYRDTSRLISYVRKHEGDGQIILMHDLHLSTAKAQASICRNLVADGYEAVTVTELAAIKGTKLITGKTYSSIK